MTDLIIHIPHSSNKIPSIEGYCVDGEVLANEQLLLTDWYTDELFASESTINIKADFSRIFCDVERFRNDKDESMSMVGMGALYTHTDSGLVMRKIENELRENILGHYYDKHHEQLNKEVDNQLLSKGKAFILDAHSFSNTPFKRDLIQSIPRPDFNIGTDSFHTPQRIIEISVAFFESRNYSIEIDKPYSGSIVPIAHYLNNSAVGSIMLEVNRKLYLKDSTNDKSKNFNIIKSLIAEYIELLKIESSKL